MITEGIRDFPNTVDAPPKGIPAAAAAAAGPAPAQLLEPAAAGRTVLRQQAATRRTRVRVVDADLRRVVLGRVRETGAWLLHLLPSPSP
ncbi:hypothetical protein E0Z10_g5573 [Xylaria hypoxylon]|uniref:Uncharacterized protein n=1 Tax=Xylaria hypoxylon TaxID=37992 RepID=A0A4Z0YXK6_9PEZI|nr:hypothetical protein E0Z10_g5573 [Xylaria hypoxylon]